MRRLTIPDVATHEIALFRGINAEPRPLLAASQYPADAAGDDTPVRLWIGIPE
jgi:hypothetical protein